MTTEFENFDEILLTVNHIEECFLSGEFTKALALSIQFLDSKLTLNEITADAGTHHDVHLKARKTFILRNAIVLPEDTLKSERNYSPSSPFHICVEFQQQNQMDDNLIDRAFAIGLQSWYEISKIEKIQNRNASNGHLHSLKSNGIRHLVAILRIFSVQTNVDNNNNTVIIRRGMNMQLLQLFIQFCVAINEKNLATELSFEILEYIEHNSNIFVDSTNSTIIQNEKSKQYVCRMIHYLFTYLIPHLHLPSEMLKHYLRNCFLESSIILIEATSIIKQQIETTTPTIEAMECSMHFCQTKYCVYPIWLHETFHQCEKNLCAKLSEVKLEQSHLNRSTLTNSIHHNTESSMRCDGQPSYVISIISRLISKLKIIRSRIMDVITSRQEDHYFLATHKTSLAIAMITLFIAWHRHRRMISRSIHKLLTSTVKLAFIKRTETAGLEQTAKR